MGRRHLATALGIGHGETRAVFTDTDVGAMALFHGAEELLGTDAVEQLLRVTGAAIARIGDTAISLFVSGPGEAAIVNDESASSS